MNRYIIPAAELRKVTMAELQQAALRMREVILRCAYRIPNDPNPHN